MSTKFQLSKTFPATAETIYEAWLDGDKHTAMTGGGATGSAEAGSKFTAWDGYIEGTNVELQPAQKIVQSWRTSEFAQNDPDSRLEISFKNIENGCEVTILHENIPDGQPDYHQGWIDHYFDPMTEYFGN